MNLKFYLAFLLIFTSIISFSQSYKLSGTVTDEQNLPLPGVAVMIKNTNSGTTTDFDGNYNISVKKGDILIFSFVGYENLEKIADGSTTLNVSMVSGVALEEVVLVGTRNQNRTAIDSPVPVDVFDAKELTSGSPQTNLNQILNYVAPSFSSNTQSISDGTDHIDPASLRGLGPDQVLVLVNGKRRHTSSLVNVNGTFGRGSVGTDLNAIPASSIERIEVLRDGAAAQYGSDAIAGVINIVLKKDVNKLSVNLQTSGYMSKNSNSLTGGIDGKNFSANVNYGIKLNDKGGFINLSGDFENRDYFNRMGAYEASIFNGYNAVEWIAHNDGYNLSELPSNLQDVKDYAQSVTYFSSQLKSDIANAPDIATLRTLLGSDVTDSELAVRGLSRSDFNMRVGQSALRGARFFANFSLPLDSNGTELYSFAGMSLRKGEAGGFFRLPNQERTYTPQYINGFLPLINSDIVDKSISVGIRGKIKDWDVDFSNTYGGNSFTYLITNSFNASQGNASKTEFNSGGPAFYQNTTNLDFSKNYEDIFEGLNVASGLEYRVENYEIIAGETSSWATYDEDGAVVTTSTQTVPKDFFGRTRPGGVQVFPGFRPENALSQYRNSIAAYTDMEADISKNFLLTGALRFENYSDFGNNLSYKLATMLKINDNLRFRAALNSGFRAPSLHQKYFNSTSTLFVNGVPNEVGLFANNSKVAQIIGIPELKPEISSSVSAGFTAQFPKAKLKLTFDAYLVGISDKVILTGTFSPTTAELQTLFTQVGATKAAFFANAIDTETRGLDAVITHNTKLGKWNLKNDLAGSFTQTKRVGDIHASEKLQTQLTTYFDESARIYLEDAVPSVKITLSNNLSSNKVSFYLRNTYFGETTEATNTVENQTVYTPKVVTDLTVGYNVSESLKFSLGANNLFDVYPDETIAANRSSGRFVYSRSSPQFGYGGRYVFAKVGFNLSDK